MSLVVFIVVAAAGSVVWWPLGRWPWARATAGLVALAVCLVLAYLLPSGLIHFGDEALQPTPFLRLWLLTGAAAALLLALVAATVERPTRLVPAALVMLAGTAGALSVTDAAGALLMVIATSSLVTLIALADRDALHGPVRVEGLRVIVAIAALGLLGIAWGATSGLGLQPATTIAAFALVAAALMLGTGTVPFHLPLTRQAEAVARPLVPLVVGWLPAALALVVLGWAQVRLVPIVPDLGLAGALIVGLGLLTLAATSVAMLLQEDVGHVVTYAGVQGLAAGVLAYAAVQPGALPAARIALLLVPLWLATLTAGVLVLDATSGSARVPALAGRLRQVPVTAVAMAVAVIVAVGVPGLAGFDARRTILDLAAGSFLGAVGLVIAATAVFAWLRLAWIGLRTPPGVAGAAAATPDAARSPWGAAERPAWPPATARARGQLAEGRALLGANRIPLAAAFTLALAALALGLSLGLGHLPAVAQGPVPMASLRPTPTPGPTESLAPTSSPTGSPAATTTVGPTQTTIGAPPTTIPPGASPTPTLPPGPSPTPGSSTGD